MWPLMGGMGRVEQSLLCLLLFQNLDNFWFLAEWCFVSKVQMRRKGNRRKGVGVDGKKVANLYLLMH